MRKTSQLLTLMVVGAMSLAAQQQGGGGGGGRTTQPSPGTTQPSPGQPGQPGQPGRPGQPGQPGQSDPFGRGQQQRMPEFQRPIFLSGKVMMEDGTAPPEPVVIQRVCNGQPFPEGYTDTKGRFSIRLGGDQTLAFTDASISNSGAFGGDPFGNDPFASRNSGISSAGPMRPNLMGCELRAELPGYRSDVVQLAQRGFMDNPDVGVITLRRLAGVTGTSISVTSLEAPKKAQKSYEKALKETRKKNPNLKKAAKELEKALAEYDQYAAAWYLMGRLRVSFNDMEGARQAFEKSVEADASYINPYQPLVRMAIREGRWDDAVQMSNQVLRLNPHVTEAHYFQAVANFNMGRMEAAEKSVQAVRASNDASQFPQSLHLLGMIHAKQGKFGVAATDFRSFLTAQPDAPAATAIQQQLHEWEELGVIEKEETAAASPQPPQQ